MRSSAAFYIFEAKLKQKKVDCKIFCNEKNAVRYTFYNKKMLNVTLFAAKKCDGVRIILDWHTTTKNYCQRRV